MSVGYIHNLRTSLSASHHSSGQTLIRTKPDRILKRSDNAWEKKICTAVIRLVAISHTHSK